jgi:hypothetical protein
MNHPDPGDAIDRTFDHVRDELMLLNSGKVERKAVAQGLRELADECIDRIDGAEESRGHDSWLTTLANGMRHAAMLLEQA